MKDVQCYELFGGVALKNHEFLFFSFDLQKSMVKNKHYLSKQHLIKQ